MPTHRLHTHLTASKSRIARFFASLLLLGQLAAPMALNANTTPTSNETGTNDTREHLNTTPQSSEHRQDANNSFIKKWANRGLTTWKVLNTIFMTLFTGVLLKRKSQQKPYSHKEAVTASLFPIAAAFFAHNLYRTIKDPSSVTAKENNPALSKKSIIASALKTWTLGCLCRTLTDKNAIPFFKIRTGAQIYLFAPNALFFAHSLYNDCRSYHLAYKNKCDAQRTQSAQERDPVQDGKPTAQPAVQ